MEARDGQLLLLSLLSQRGAGPKINPPQFFFDGIDFLEKVRDIKTLLNYKLDAYLILFFWGGGLP